MISIQSQGQRRHSCRRFFFVAVLALSCATAQPPSAFDPAKLRELDAAINDAIASHRIPGGVLLIERNGSQYKKAYGNRALVPSIEPITADTIYDAASITKVVATAPSVWLLIQQGKVDLDAPAKRYLPEFVNDEITVRQLMTHTSGLRPDLTLTEKWHGYDEGIRRALLEQPRNRPGIIFRYSDINYILLGEIVRRVSGETLDVFAKRHIFEPLGMKDSGFRPFDYEAPPRNVPNRIAPTEQDAEFGMLRGIVHDPTARRMGGVAGHAGLFTTVDDMARFERAMLNGGGGVFTAETIRAMTAVQSPRGVAVRRAAGFDIDSLYSRPRGDVFPIGSYGHTGWTGGFFWIDPYSRTFYVFLSNRVHPDGKGVVTALQKQVGTLVGESVRGFDFTNVPGALEKRPGGGVRWVIGGGDAMNGIDVLAANAYQQLRGVRLGLITDHSGIDRAGNPTMDLLRSAPGVQLVALFSPEHGIRGTADEKVADTIDEVSGLPVYSLYGERRAPTQEQLATIDVLAYDIQDVGTRFYTYISTLGLSMEAAAQAHKKFVVLDRVNPIGGSIVEGPVREGQGDFVAYHPIVIRHGMTVGELARMYRDEKNLDLDLTVIQIRSWKRDQWQDEAGLPWINPSPNMRSLTEAGLYPGIGILESALSVGRGTATPFEVVGAPYIDEKTLTAEMTALHLPGIAFEPARFTPTASIHKGESCGGVRMTITDRRALRSVDVGIAMATVLYRLYPQQFDLQKLPRLLRHPATVDAIRAGEPLDKMHALWMSDFAQRRAKYLLYE